VLALGALGSGIESRLSPMSLEVPGTPSARAESVLRAKFGNTIPMAILLRGPTAEVQRQGRALTQRLQKVRGAQTLSPWDGTQAAPAPAPTPASTTRPMPAGDTQATPAPAQPSTTFASFHPESHTALLLLTYRRPPSAALATVTATEALLAGTVRAPVHSYLTGVAVIGKAIQVQTLKDTETAEMIALPALIAVLLIVFRSPVAAGVPLMMGGATVIAGRGLLWLASWLTPINSLGVAIAAMMSLALGVDYALLMVSRLRQELRDGHTHQDALRIASRAAGRTIAAAGGTLALTMLAASAVATPGLLGPVAIGVVISGLLSVALARSAMPALLLLLGPSLDRFTIKLPGSRSGRRTGRLRRLGERVVEHPAIVAPVIMLGMLALAAPVATLRMGPPDASELPASSPARQAVDELEKTIGPGWTAPFVIVASARDGAITTQSRLRALMRWQAQVASQPDVAAVLGPGSVAGARAKLAQANVALRSAPKHLAGAQHGIVALRSGLARAGDGVQALRKGLAAAADGAGALGAGAGRAREGARRLTTETGRAREGAHRLDAETGRARKGARKLTRESARAHRGAQKLATESGAAHQGASRLQEGLGEAAAGSRALASGLDEAAAGAQRLEGGDRELSAGAQTLAAGMNALDGTVHTALAPVEAIAGMLRDYAGRLEAMQISQMRVREQVAQASQALHEMPVSHEDPRYIALLADLEGIASQVQGDYLSELSRIEGAIRAGLHALSELPAQLAQLTESLDRLTAGADRLATGARESEEGARELNVALHRLAAGGHTLSGGLERLSGGAGKLAHGLGELQGGNRKLAHGLGELQGGNRKLAHGLGELQGGDRRLAGGLGELQAGSQRLTGGLGELQSGDQRLAGGLSGADAKTGRLAAGLGAAQRPLATYETMLAAYQRDYALLHADSPKALDSGYLVLTALDGTVSPVREQVAQMVNVDSGGQTARMMVIADSPPSSAATAELSRRLRDELPALARASGASVQIGQGAQYLLDYKNANTARFPWLVFALAIVATLTLIVVLRALLLPLIAVLLNLVTIFVALGALVLLTEHHVISGPGGPSYIDAASGAGIIAIMFVLSIDYEVFLLTRMRERFDVSRDAQDAITHGLRHTAGVIAGSAAIMTAVFLAFASASVLPLRQFGVGLTIAVLLDATVVRLVLLPAVMRLLGPRVWWMPEWIARRLPAVE
jgi:X-X-X-Leu-X-X-Gly heptad repeat protein